MIKSVISRLGVLVLVFCLPVVACTSNDTRWVSAQPSVTSAAPASTAGPSHPETGLRLGIADRLTDLSSSVRKARLAKMRQNGVRYLRMDIEWRYAEKTLRDYDWGDFDPTVVDVSSSDIALVLILGYAPNFAAGRSDCAGAICAPVATDKAVRAYGDFVYATATHYLKLGAKVLAYEVWNEANLGRYWPKPNPELYARLLKAAAAGLSKADPRHQIKLLSSGPASSSDDDGNIEPLPFLERVLAAGGCEFVSAVAAHPYVKRVPGKDRNDGWGQMLAVHELMASYGPACGSKQIWVTEFGYQSADVGLDNQAAYLEVALKLYKTYPWAGPFFWYVYQDGGGETWGLIDENGDHKPALAVFRRFAAVV